MNVVIVNVLGYPGSLFEMGHNCPGMDSQVHFVGSHSSHGPDTRKDVYNELSACHSALCLGAGQNSQSEGHTHKKTLKQCVRDLGAGLIVKKKKKTSLG